MLALAQILQEEFHVQFILESNTTFFSDLIKSKGIEQLNTLELSELSDSEIVVLDGYSFNTDYQQNIKNTGAKLVCIDDHQRSDYVADVIVNHAADQSIDQPAGILTSQLRLGLPYRMIRPEFRFSQNTSKSEIQSVFISFGGADIDDLAGEVVREIVSTIPSYQVNVLVGESYDAAHLYAFDQITIHKNLDAHRLNALIKNCDLAIVSASTISFECASIGIGMIVVKTVDNQQGIFNTFKELDMGVCIATPGSKLIIDEVKSYSHQLANHHIVSQKKHFSKPSSEALIKVFRSLTDERHYELAQANENDMQLYFDWVNDDEVRKQSLRFSPISWEEHTEWFTNKLADPNCQLFKLLNKEETPVGQIRLEIKTNNVRINYSVAANFRGKGLGRLLIKKALEVIEEQYNEFEWVEAEVKNDNISSLSLFQDFGFIKEVEDKITTFKKSIS